MIIHLSISEFSSAVAIASDPSLLNTPFVIAQGARDRALILSPSPVAKREGIARGMRLTHAQLIIPSLQVNMRAGEMPPADEDGKTFLKVPVNGL